LSKLEPTDRHGIAGAGRRGADPDVIGRSPADSVIVYLTPRRI
jgi:hypothetical protein